jgi:lysine 2,3-aminomutase
MHDTLAAETPSSRPLAGGLTMKPEDVGTMLDRYGYPEEIREVIASENLLPLGLLGRLQAAYPQHSGLLEQKPFLFTEREQYSGLEGFREVIAVLERSGIHLGHVRERELFVEVYRFKATRHALNSINWEAYERDSMYQLVFPQPGMIRREVVDAYLAAGGEEARQAVVREYIRETNPHDGKQLLNKPWLEREDGALEILPGSQHKYPQCQLVFDRSTQNCFAYCTYCFRHAQVRGDEDMFIQEDIGQVHDYLRAHPEVSDLLITGGDAGYLPLDRLRAYVLPLLEDPALLHVRAVRIGSRMLSYQPERVLERRYDAVLETFALLAENGIQVSWMAHFSTPRELLNPGTLAAIRRLRRYGVVIRSQSPIMNHISLFTDERGEVDVERSARNWIDLGNLLAMLSIHFHSMYCARVTGEHHYFTAPLAKVSEVFQTIYRSLPSISRPSRYITMTTSAGKLSILGTVEVNGETAFALKFNEARNMEWMDRVFLAKFDERENAVHHLVPFDTERFFYAGELAEIEDALAGLHPSRVAEATAERPLAAAGER